MFRGLLVVFVVCLWCQAGQEGPLGPQCLACGVQDTQEGSLATL